MQTWKKMLLAVGIPLVIMLLILATVTCIVRVLRSRRFPKHPKIPRDEQGLDGSGAAGLFPYDRTFSGVKGLDLAAMEGIEMAAKWRESNPARRFSWIEATYLLADAIDRGWAAFAFTYQCSSQCPASSSDGFVLCTKCCLGEAFQPEIAWEIGPGADYMQLIRLNPRLVRPAALQNSRDFVQALQSALPLPGPALPSSTNSFPPEGYFEVTIVAIGTMNRSIVTSEMMSSSTESENIKLILRPSPSEKYPIASKSNNGCHHSASAKKSVQARILANGHERRKKTFDATAAESAQESRTLGVGFSPGSAPPFRLPGLDQGSVGWHSDGRIFLNGMLQVDGDGSRKRSSGWAISTNTTVGCGYNPKSRRFIFTLDGDLVAEMSCSDHSSREFSYPLHATVASNYDVTLLVNFGQCSFEYLPANEQRVADPSSNSRSDTTTTTTTTSNSSVVRSSGSTAGDDSSELFSMRRLDSQWWSGRRTASVSHPEVEGDLFEISLG